MKPQSLSFPALVAILAAWSGPLLSQDTAPQARPWPFHDQTPREAVLASLRLKLATDRVFPALPKGISLYLDADGESDEEGWLMVTVRQRNGAGSGGDPNVSPALVHFYVRENDGRIDWYDVVEDRRRPYADFLKDREAP